MPLADQFTIEVRSAIPGRVRWDVPALLGDSALASEVERAFVEKPDVISISASPVTGRILLNYKPDLSPSDLTAELEAVLRRAAAAAAAAAVAGQPVESVPQQVRSLFDIIASNDKLRRSGRNAIALAFAARLVEAAPPALIGMGVDIVSRPSASFLARLGFLGLRSQLVALGLFGAAVWTLDSLMEYWQRLAFAELSNSAKRELQVKVYDGLQRMDVAQIEGRPVTEWLNILQNDVARVVSFAEEGIDPIVTMITNGIVVGATALRFSPAMAAIQLLALPALYVVSRSMLRPIRERQKAVRADEARLSAALHANLSAMPVIASFVRQEGESARVEELGRQASASAKQLAHVSAAYVPTVQMVAGLGYLGSLLYGAQLARRGAIPAGAYSIMGYSSLRLLNSLGYLGVTLDRYQRTKVSLNRVAEVISARTEMLDGSRDVDSTGTPHTIAFESVDFEYEIGRPVLRGVNLKFQAGAVIGIVGPTGAGKSTILKLLLRFYDVKSGAVKLDDVDIRELRLGALRGEIAQVPQQLSIMPGTVHENIAYGRPDAPMREVIAAARVSEADGFIRKLPSGYETVIAESGAQLSSGQRQRLAIARAVLAHRPILLFDEATSAIDYETEAAIQQSLQTVVADKTTIIVAHRLSTIRHADLIYVIDDGTVRESGRHDDLVRADGIYASMWRVQTGERRPRRGRRPARPKPRPPQRQT